MLKFTRLFLSTLGVGLICLLLGTVPGWGQNLAGTVAVSVFDQAGASVPGAQLQIKNLATNDTRRAETQQNGTYSFPDLTFGTYELIVTKDGFATQVFQSVLVQTARVTTVKVVLAVAAAQQTVTVSETVSSLVETDSTVLSNTIDTKQVVNLPLAGRNVMSLAFLVPGWASGGTGTSGTWNNMPGGAVVSADFDGVPGISNRFRSGGFNYGTTVVQPRIEDVAEMTVQTAQLDLSGSGTSSMRIAIVGRRGTNQFHGRLYEDFRNTVLNSNSWSNNARRIPRSITKLNEFGGNIGGPIKKDKIFFFGTWSQRMQPNTQVVNTTVLNPATQQGNFTYTNTSGVVKTVNVLQTAGTAGYPSKILPSVAAQLTKINGVLSQGILTQGSDPNISTLSFASPGSNKVYYPTVRGDYLFSERLRVNLSYSQQKSNNYKTYAAQFPGGIDPLDYTSSRGNNRIAGLGVDWTVRPTLINQFRGGYMYQYSAFSPENLGLDYSKIDRQTWGYGQGLYAGAYPRRTISSFYPLLSANDNLVWQKGSHTYTFGGSWYAEHDHYWNGPGGEPNYSFGINAQDPLSAIFTSAFADMPTSQRSAAQNLYAELVGRVSRVTIGVGRPVDTKTKQYKPYGQFNLNEFMQAAGFWAQDKWRLRSNLTLNYGLRWDVVGDNYSVDGLYSTLPTEADVWGPTPVGAIFKPGTLGGVSEPVFKATQHAYHTNTHNLSPAVAIAWSPNFSEGILGKVLPKDRTVIRAGYSLRFYTEGSQNFWAFGSNGGNFFYQQGSLVPNPTPALGNFTPGSLTYGDPLPPYYLTPATYQTSVPASQMFASGWFRGLNPGISMPFVEQWNFGIQRQIGAGSAIEVRYVGNLGRREWTARNINETNIFENGFLTEFNSARNNLAINRANGKGASFQNNALPGQVNLPIFTAAFGSATSSNFRSGTYVTYMDTGAAGAMANDLAGNTTFLCNMIGTAAFPACASKVGNVPGAGYPINFWQANPYAPGTVANYLDATGKSNYNALQVDFRQRPTHGMQFNVNYTLAHSLNLGAQNQIQSESGFPLTNRNFRLNYQPSNFDIRHTFRVNGTYDLPFGKGQFLLKNAGPLDRVVNGWTWAPSSRCRPAARYRSAAATAPSTRTATRGSS